MWTTGLRDWYWSSLTIKLSDMFTVLLMVIYGFAIDPFSTNVPFTDKLGSWFLLAKCLKNTCGRVTFC